MQKDYILEMIEELGRVLRAVIGMKRSEPLKALASIQTVFKATKFESKDNFDRLTVGELEAFITEKNMNLQTLDTLTDLLFEEADIRLDNGEYEIATRLVNKLDFLVTYISKQEAALRIISLKRAPQRERVSYLLKSLK
ncbi:hypothetical protein SAMN05428949_0163 [Chitinophaga sp. YR627]|uniref:hypothetical protein n=1 Tax=Chitinophaga sp. YR627 TaxID=1881041 RepID=UPI0008E9A452|nr:hypothetical protein [Chitinophaga sp. YR627]SFM60992.1 hypothetical protein SAMN05428949_0163 [Chitinophaga sp. YR627]